MNQPLNEFWWCVVALATVDVVVELEQLLLLLLIVLDLFDDIEEEIDVFTVFRQFGGNAADAVAVDDDEDVVVIFDAFESLSVDDDVFVLLYLPNDVE